MNLATLLFIVSLLALLGGFIAKKLKVEPLVGYILSGVIAGGLMHLESFGIEKVSELGAILLLFSIGLELSVGQFRGFFKKTFVASVVSVILTSIILISLLRLLNFDLLTSALLSIGFSLSSTAVVVKMLFNMGESETIHGRIMVAWLLIQDLLVIPIMILMPLFRSGASFDMGILFLVFKSFLMAIVAFFLGKNIVPFVIHRIASINSRELLLLTSVALATGTAYGASLLGISPALGAFLAGFIISESQENHAVFAETRPLRDLFVAFFFVSVGLTVNSTVLISSLWTIISLVVLVFLVKAVVIFLVSLVLKFSGKTLVNNSLGLSQVGEFAFIIFSTAGALGLISKENASIGIAVGLITLILTPFIYSRSGKLWRLLKSKSTVFSSYDKNKNQEFEMKDHIVILGFGRVGGWVGRSLIDHNINFVVVDYNQDVINKCEGLGITAIYGDPSEKEVLDAANVKEAKAVVIAIPDRISQESVIAHVQSVSPGVKIISRVHLDEDWEKLKMLRVDKLVQPEFEAATSIIKNILVSLGKDNEEIKKSLKSIRLSHAKI